MSELKTISIEQAFEFTLKMFKDMQDENAEFKAKLEIAVQTLEKINKLYNYAGKPPMEKITYLRYLANQAGQYAVEALEKIKGEN